MSDRWIQPTPTQIELRTHIGITRYVFGVPFLLFGLYFFLRYFVGGIIAYAAAGDWWGLVTGTPGWFLILVFASLFLIPGILIACTYRHFVLDIVRDEIVETRSIVFWNHVSYYALSSFTHLLITSKQASKASLYTVWLVAANDKRTLVGSMAYPDEARALADAVGTLACLPVSTMSEAQWLER